MRGLPSLLTLSLAVVPLVPCLSQAPPAPAPPPPQEPPPALVLVKAGRLGQKSGAGFFSYAKGSRGQDDPAFAAILEKVRTGKRAFTQEEITDRLFLPMLVEASRVLSDGIVRSPADVDMGLILGIGFPAFRGGILRWADSQGLGKVLEKLKKYESLGPRFQPTEAMRKLAAEGKGFYPES